MCVYVYIYVCICVCVSVYICYIYICYIYICYIYIYMLYIYICYICIFFFFNFTNYKTSLLFLWHIFVNLMEKEPCTKFRGACQISRSYKNKKFWIQRKWRHTRECTKHFASEVLYIFLFVLWRKSLL